MFQRVQNKKWVQKPLPNPETVDKLANELNISATLATLIAQKGLTTYEEAKTFFNPSLEVLPNPFQMHGMEKAVDRIQKAIKNQEPILIYGDYDVDGTTAVALIYTYLSSFYDKVNYYVPDRFKEGYGISYEGIDHAAKQGATLMIALDCGIKALEEVKYAQEQAIDVIICDHHTPGDELPAAYSILNPKQQSCNYPYKELSGCGIGYKLVTALYQKLKKGLQPQSLLDYVAISSAADIVPITGENRVLTYFGLEKINKGPAPSVQALLEISGAKTPIDVTDLVFKVGPRINAAGRIAHAHDAVELLISKTEEEAKEQVTSVNNNNQKRQHYDKGTHQQALEIIEKDEALQESYTTVLFNPEWHKGVIGIAASRLIENYFRPTILLTESNGLAVGSARSVPGFNLYEALKQCDDLLEQYGGHKAAAGLALKKENLEAFIERFEEVVKERIHPDQLIPVLEYDLELSLDEITPSFCRTIQRFGPFGPENMKPILYSKNAKNKYPPKVVGENHLKLFIGQEGGGIDAIAFNMHDYLEHVQDGKPFDICYTIEENVWNGKVNVQLNIKDIKVQE